MTVDHSEALADNTAALVRLEQQLEVVRDILDEIREEVQWAIRNERPIRIDRITATAQEWAARMLPERKPVDPTMTIYCAECGIEANLTEALEQGWEQLTGGCPDCLAKEDAGVEASERPTEPSQRQTELF